MRKGQTLVVLTVFTVTGVRFFFFQWDLVCDKKSLTKTSSTIFFLGVMVGAVVFGYLCDK